MSYISVVLDLTQLRISTEKMAINKGVIILGAATGLIAITAISALANFGPPNNDSAQKTRVSPIPTITVTSIQPTIVIPTNTPEVSTPVPATNTPVPPTAIPAAPTSIPIPPTSVPVSGGFSCDIEKTCDEMVSCEEAYYQLTVCGYSRRDGDKDGVPCEDICPGG